ncbi:MAG: bifunctional diaminohydroxyphosphoribosylaminopyrimidine deaminase/5-amino-6-(5-phosphoribosylamino)uracil reductase RibD [Isosphaeraceae bacterium]
MNPDDFSWMGLALAEAAKGRGSVEPNPMVGAVIVNDGRAVGIGHHARFGGPHGEVVAIQAAGPDARGATLYVTLEPCCHHGKTPPCTMAILEAGISRVVAAIRDPFPAVSGKGIARLRDSGVQVEVGVGGVEAAELLAPFLKRTLTGLPYVIGKWAMTLDGKTAVAAGDSRWISSAESRARVHELRGRVDAIVAGIGTVLADDPQLTARPAGPRIATRVVLDTRVQLPPSSLLAMTAREVPVLVAATNEAPVERVAALRELGCEVVAFPGPARVAIQPLLEELGKRGMTNVLVEGGGRVLGSFLDGGHLDEVDVYLAPILEGGDHPRTAARGRGLLRMADARRLAPVSYEQVGRDLRIRGTLPQPWRSQLDGLRGEPATSP